jgi:2-C-methyl-D-erythritol 4-phosphate cytidylyltransferase
MSAPLNPPVPANQAAFQANTPQGPVWAVVPAAGVGTRMGAPVPKQFLVLNGLPVLVHSVTALLAHRSIAGVIVVVSASDEQSSELLAGLAALPENQGRLMVSADGGMTRANTVINGLKALQKVYQAQPNDWALVHDAARPGLSLAALNRLINAVLQSQVGGLLALPATDTIKRAVSSFAAEGIVSVKKTLARESIWHAQTPQMFRLGPLIGAMNQFNQVTDEASAMEAAGHTVQLILGERRNLKVTVAEDLPLLEAMIQGDENWKFA